MTQEQQVIQFFERERARSELEFDRLAAESQAALAKVIKREERRLVRWAAVNVLWTLALAISSALWWLR